MRTPIERSGTPNFHNDSSAAEGQAASRAAAALRRLARREDLKAAVLASPTLYAVLLRAAQRYVAGETLDEALGTARALAPRHRATVDFMGEDTRDAAAAREATNEFLALTAALGPVVPDAELARTSISLDLSHIGLAVEGPSHDGQALAMAHLVEIASAAERLGREVIISMEGSARTDAILGIHGEVSRQYPRVGITVQAALHRTPEDLTTPLARGTTAARIRLVKGAYAESAETALVRGPALDAQYARLARQLVDAAAGGQRVSIATHDPHLLTTLTGYVAERGGPSAFPDDALQFEMLHGVTPYRLDAVANAGYATQVYLVYGREWYLYLCHRLAEHPPSLLEALADCVEALPVIAGEPAAMTSAMIGSSARANRA